MTATQANPVERLASRLASQILSIQPIFDWARHQARTMMIKRSAQIGVNWPEQVQQLRSRGEAIEFSPAWEAELAEVRNPTLSYPDYYLTSFHAYPEGNLSWEAALEVEVAAYAVHARIWPDSGADGDARLRRSFLKALQESMPTSPQRILDMGCSVGMSTFALQRLYPQAHCTGVDLSPYFLAVARYQAQRQGLTMDWVHAPAEATDLPAASFDLVASCLMFHELPSTASVGTIQEAYRLLQPGGYWAIMDMNPRSEVYQKMPAYILTLLKSTEPYIDDYFTLDLEGAIVAAGFNPPTVVDNTPRHRTLVAQKPG